MIGKNKVVDCFIFFNELDILEIRLNETDPFVDYWVLVESTRAFNNQSKDLFFNNSKDEERFNKFKDKIIHVIVEDAPDTNNSWDIEIFVRNATLRGVNLLTENGKISDDDWVILSDTDEIIRSDSIIKESFNDDNVYKFNLSFRYYKFNCRAVNDGWAGPIMVKKGLFKDPQNTRHNNDPSIPWSRIVYIDGAGWHFSYMGGLDKIIAKINTGGHQELNTDYFKQRERLEEKIKFGEDLFDRKDQHWEFIRSEDYPKFVLDNPEKFKEYFHPMKTYKFVCVIPFTGNYDSLNWAVSSLFNEISKYSEEYKPIHIVNNTGKDFEYDRIELSRSRYFVETQTEPYLLPQVLNKAMKDAKLAGREFMMWMHDDAALKSNALKIMFDKYEQIKDTKWFSLYLSKDGDVCSFYNYNYNYQEGVWYDPMLFPLYFMDCHYTRVAKLRGWNLEYANWDNVVDYVVHPGSHTIKENSIIRQKNDLRKEGEKDLYRRIWGGEPGNETNNDPHANGTI